jgi:8-oxo-dGTP diphosphatase
MKKALEVVGAAIVRDGRCLVTRRGPAMSAPLKWEFPGGKVEPGESHHQALVREIKEELDVEVTLGPCLGRGDSSVGSRRIELYVYAATWTKGDLRLAEHFDHGWFTGDELDQLDWPEADLPILPAIKRYLDVTTGR